MTTARISPTAHYTGYVWVRAGLSPPALGTLHGRIAYRALAPVDAMAARFFAGVGLERMLLSRHAAIDAAVEQAIAEGAEQVLEIAGGLSGRSLRLGAKYPHVRFLEGDLPGMVAEKTRRLQALGDAGDHVGLRHLDFLAVDGPTSLSAAFAAPGEVAEALAETMLDPSRKTVVVTEGLLNYLDRRSVEAAWARIAAALAPAGGWYVSDLHLRSEVLRYRVARVFLRSLGVVARGAMELHHEDVAEVVRVATDAGFDTVDTRDAAAWCGEVSAAPLVRVLFGTVAQAG